MDLWQANPLSAQIATLRMKHSQKIQFLVVSMCQIDWTMTDTSIGPTDVASGAKLSEDDGH